MGKVYPFILCSILLLAVSGCLAKETDVNEFAGKVKHDEVVASKIFGFGWNIDPVHVVPEVNDEKNWEIFERLVKDASPGWMRLVLYEFGWQPKEGGPYIWKMPGGHPKMLKFYRFLDIAQDLNIPVEVNNWHLANTWMSETGKTTGHPIDEDHFGQYVADLVYHLRIEKGYDVVKYVAIWNEPGSFAYTSPSANYPDSFMPLYKSLHEHLIDLGIREQVEVIGIEGFFDYVESGATEGSPNYFKGNDPNLITRIIQQVDDYIDIVSIHDYWSVFDYERTPGKTVEERFINKLVKGVQEDIKKADTNGKVQPLVIGELGCHAYGSGEKEAETSEIGFTASLFIAEAALRGFNAGAKGIQRWSWNLHPGYQAVSVANTWSAIEPKDETHAVDHNYYPLALLSWSIPNGADVLGISDHGGVDRNGIRRVFAGAFRWEDGFSFIVINDDYVERTVRLDVGKDMQLNKYFVSENMLDDFNNGGKFVGPSITDTLEPRSITVYTTKIR